MIVATISVASAIIHRELSLFRRILQIYYRILGVSLRMTNFYEENEFVESVDLLHQDRGQRVDTTLRIRLNM